MKSHTPFLVKLLRNEVLQFFVMGGFFLFLVSIVFVISEFLNNDHQKAHIAIAQSLQIIVVFATAWIIARLFKRILAHRYESKAAKEFKDMPEKSFEVHVPRYIITLFNWSVMLISAAYISTSMFGEQAWNLLTAGGIMGAGIAFSLQGLVQDLISGLILDVERRVKIGDWIRTGDDVFGEIIRMTWRYIEIRTEENTLKLIPNRDFTSVTYENLSHFKGIFVHKITLPLDHNVPFDRIQRVLMDALLSIPEVVKTEIYSIAVSIVNEGGLTVDVRFGVPGYHRLIPLRHKVYEVLSRKLWESGIGISESFGAYTITQPAASFKYLEDPKAGDVLKHVPLFDVLTVEERKLLGQKAKRILLNKADILMTIGDPSDSLFVIAEGVVDVIIPIQEGEVRMDKVVATLGSGNFVGDRALLLGEKRSATVKAKTQVVCYEVTKKDFEPILKARPAMIHGLSEVVLQREASTSAQISEAKKNLPKELNLKDELVKAMQKFFGV